MKHEHLAYLTPAQVLFRQRGASLLEGIAYLGIAAIVVLGAVSLLTGAFGSAKTNQTTEEVVALRTAVRKLYAGQTYPAAMLGSLIPAKALPNTLTIDTATKTAKNSWGGDVAIAGNTTDFTITYNKVPQDVCIGVVSGANGWKQISGAAGANAIDEADLPAKAADAAKLCTGDTNTIVFTAT